MTGPRLQVIQAAEVQEKMQQTIIAEYITTL